LTLCMIETDSKHLCPWILMAFAGMPTSSGGLRGTNHTWSGKNGHSSGAQLLHARHNGGLSLRATRVSGRSSSNQATRRQAVRRRWGSPPKGEKPCDLGGVWTRFNIRTLSSLPSSPFNILQRERTSSPGLMCLLATMMIFFVDSRVTIRAMAFGWSGRETKGKTRRRQGSENKISHPSRTSVTHGSSSLARAKLPPPLTPGSNEPRYNPVDSTAAIDGDGFAQAQRKHPARAKARWKLF